MPDIPVTSYQYLVLGLNQLIFKSTRYASLINYSMNLSKERKDNKIQVLQAIKVTWFQKHVDGKGDKPNHKIK